jgi:hypothetical protein
MIPSLSTVTVAELGWARTRSHGVRNLTVTVNPMIGWSRRPGAIRPGRRAGARPGPGHHGQCPVSGQPYTPGRTVSGRGTMAAYGPARARRARGRILEPGQVDDAGLLKFRRVEK